MKKALIIANGEIPSRALISELQKSHDLSICADGAANSLRAIEIIPSIIIGDLDSISSETKAYFSNPNLSSPVEVIMVEDQNFTDLEKAFRLCVKRGISSVTVVGIKGKRFDHAISNLSIIQKFYSKLQIELRDDFGSGVFLIAKSSPALKVFHTVPEDPVSLIAFGVAEGITTTGLKYALEDEALEWALRDGQSNSATGTNVTITLRQGVLFIFHTSDINADD